MNNSIQSIRLANVTQKFPSPNNESDLVTVLDDISLTLQGNEIVMLLGPSGCGKSTLMKMMGGVRPFNVKTPTSGEVYIDNQICEGHHNDVVMVFQKYLNRPDLTVLENVLFPFRAKLWRDKFPNKKEREEFAKSLLEEVDLADKMNYPCSKLSGGQNQRVAIARALVVKPRYILMDEPFGALDAQTRNDMQKLLLRLHRQHESLVVFITHDIDEALKLGDRIICLSNRPAKISYDIHLDLPQEMRDSNWLVSASEIRNKIYSNL